MTPHIVRPRALLDTATVSIGELVGAPQAAGVRPMAPPPQHSIVLPLSGMFTLHDGARAAVTATPNHAVLVTAGRTYGLSFPAPTGDHCLVLKWSDDALAAAIPEATGRSGFDRARYDWHALLPPSVLLERSLLWHSVVRGAAEPLEAEDRALQLAAATLACARRAPEAQTAPPRNAGVRRRRQLARVTEAIAACPEHAWSLAALARIAGMSAFHLARTFRADVGTSVYDYVLRARLGRTLAHVLEPDADLAAIAHDAGFSSHSHYTARFRAMFGLTPSELRRVACARGAAAVRTIATAGARRRA